jgi:trehalose synthase
MELVSVVHVPARRLEPVAELYGATEMLNVRRAVLRLSGLLRGGMVWNVNSTAHGGGVAELLRSIVSYARGAGVDCRWAVIGGNPSFFHLTKRLHNALHGLAGDDSILRESGKAEYEHVSALNATELLAQCKPGDVAILHDPQTLGLAPFLTRHGIHVIWRCHIGTEKPNEHSRAAWDFLAPYLSGVKRCVFTRAAYVPEGRTLPLTSIIAPTIDPFSAKNQPMTPDVARSILVHAGLFEGPPPHEVIPEFKLEDGSLSRVNRGADVMRLGRACCEGKPLVVQISRWDRLKDHIGVLQGFAQYVERGGVARLILAGPNVHAVADDPEGAEVFAEVLAAYRELPHGVRSQAELANLPMADAEENAAMVNALQRQASIVVQKSIKEGFGLTVAEAMWKGKPVVATRVGGIQDQIEHEVSGILLDDPHDYGAFADALHELVSAPERATELGEHARARVRERFLSLRSLYAFADLISELLEAPEELARVSFQSASP